MNRSDHIAALALSVSLVLHGAAFYAVTQVAITQWSGQRYQSASRLPPIENATITSPILMDRPLAPLISDPPQVRNRDRAERPTVAPPPAAVALLEVPKPTPIRPVELAPASDLPPMPRTDEFGELTGTPQANAMHSLSGDRPMQAPKAEQDQPYIGMNPSGKGNPMDLPGDGLANKQKPTAEAQSGNNGRGNSPDPPAGKRIEKVVDRPQPAKPTLVAEPDTPKLTVPAERLLGSMPTDGLGNRAVNPPANNPAARVNPRIAMAMALQGLPGETNKLADGASDNPAAASAGKAGLPDAAASSSSTSDPAPMNDAESDAFSKLEQGVYVPGRVDARFGRKVKTVRPRLSLAGQYDLVSLPSPTVILLVRSDETGRPREVKIVRSSGSNEVDQPCKLAMYEWWFEPPRDAKGNPRPAEMLWTINFRVR